MFLGFIDNGSDFFTLMNIFKSINPRLVPIQVTNKLGNIQTVYINPDKLNRAKNKARKKKAKLEGKKRYAERGKAEHVKAFYDGARKAFIGLTTALGTTIKSINREFFFRHRQRGFKESDIMKCLTDPVHTQVGSNKNGSKEYWSNEWIAIVMDNGVLKTAYIIEKEKVGRRMAYEELNAQESGGNSDKE